MSIRDWVKSKLTEREIETESIGDQGILTTYAGRERLIAVAETGDSPLDADELEAMLNVLPNCEAIVLIRRSADAGVFELARERGVLIDTFGRIQGALVSTKPMHEFQDRDEVYMRSKLISHSKVSGIVRIGLNAWRIERLGLRDLTIITHDRYEFPVDELYGCLAEHPNLTPDMFVITNPNTDGLSRRVTDAAAETGVEIHLLKRIYSRLHRD